MEFHYKQGFPRQVYFYAVAMFIVVEEFHIPLRQLGVEVKKDIEENFGHSEYHMELADNVFLNGHGEIKNIRDYIRKIVVILAEVKESLHQPKKIRFSASLLKHAVLYMALYVKNQEKMRSPENQQGYKSSIKEMVLHPDRELSLVAVIASELFDINGSQGELESRAWKILKEDQLENAMWLTEKESMEQERLLKYLPVIFVVLMKSKVDDRFFDQAANIFAAWEKYKKSHINDDVYFGLKLAKDITKRRLKTITQLADTKAERERHVSFVSTVMLLNLGIIGGYSSAIGGVIVSVFIVMPVIIGWLLYKGGYLDGLKRHMPKILSFFFIFSLAAASPVGAQTAVETTAVTVPRLLDVVLNSIQVITNILQDPVLSILSLVVFGITALVGRFIWVQGREDYLVNDELAVNYAPHSEFIDTFSPIKFFNDHHSTTLKEKLWRGFGIAFIWISMILPFIVLWLWFQAGYLIPLTALYLFVSGKWLSALNARGKQPSRLIRIITAPVHLLYPINVFVHHQFNMMAFHFSKPFLMLESGGLRDLLLDIKMRGEYGNFSDPDENIIINSIKSLLTKKDYKILALSYGLENMNKLSNREIGDKIGVSSKRVKDIRNRILQDLSLELKFTPSYFSQWKRIYKPVKLRLDSSQFNIYKRHRYYTIILDGNYDDEAYISISGGNLKKKKIVGVLITEGRIILIHKSLIQGKNFFLYSRDAKMIQEIKKSREKISVIGYGNLNCAFCNVRGLVINDPAVKKQPEKSRPALLIERRRKKWKSYAQKIIGKKVDESAVGKLLKDWKQYERSVMEPLASEQEGAVDYSNVRREFIPEYMRAVLTDKEFVVIYLSYGMDGEKPLTLKEIGERFGLSSSYIGRLVSSAGRKLNRAM
ncbi:MAG: hypothetical protein KC618_04625, partial [Candidatus Omnitrophica bacterium]|nr:hypothetical protein [Candidatus Omnitrophota bacterium]